MLVKTKICKSMSVKQSIKKLIPAGLKQDVKYLYQVIYRWRNHLDKINCNKKMVTLSKPETHVFFGYYDVRPFNDKTDEIIYLNVYKDLKCADIMLSHLGNVKEEQKLASSSAWNWQQGVRLRWMPNDCRKIAFNDYDGTHYFAHILDIDTKEDLIIDKPLYDITPDGKYGFSLNFERLGVKRPGYGYTCRPYIENISSLPSEGIDMVNLETGESTQIITYDEIAKLPGCESADYRNNYLNHICVSPQGDKFLFFWLTIEGDFHHAYMIVYDIINKKMTPLETNFKVSHYVWEDNNTVIATSLDKSYNCWYFKYSVDGKKEQLNPEVLTRDGHPSLYTEDKIITDTYPNRSGFQELFIAGYKTGKEMLASIYHNCCVTEERRTDLHPRLNIEKSIISFDSNQKKYRTLNFLYI